MNQNNSLSTGNSSELPTEVPDYFEGLFENRPSKFFFVSFSFVGILTVITAIVGVVWYERSGFQLYRTLINRLVAWFSFAAIQGFVLVQLVDTIRFIFSAS